MARSPADPRLTRRALASLRLPARVLAINSGSSSLKYRLFQMPEEAVLDAGLIGGIGAAGGDRVDHREALARVFAALECPDTLGAIGHRVVHGGDAFSGAVRVDDAVLERIRGYERLAPLHNPPCLAGIETAMRHVPDVPQVAVFDTAFHQTMPAHASHYAIPLALAREHGLRRYGFHGTSHQYVAEEAARLLGRPLASLRLITLHLGNGASACAIRGGRSVDTTMGMTPLEGLVMGTRSGDVDPGLVTYLQRHAGLSAEAVERLLNEASGLLGLCGTNDMREVHRLAAAGQPDARLAEDIFCYRIRKCVGAYFAALGGADAVVFTGGVGENDPAVRESVCRDLEPLGIGVDAARNTANASQISPDRGAVAVLVIPTNEELAIARQTVACLIAGAEMLNDRTNEDFR